MLTEEDHVEIHALDTRGWSVAAISRHTGRDPKTLREHRRARTQPSPTPSSKTAYSPPATSSPARRSPTRRGQRVLGSADVAADGERRAGD
jgi:IS30 family transposase